MEIFPDQNFFHPGSRIRIKVFKYFNQNMIRVVHPASGSWLFTHPGSRGHKGTGSRIRISNTKFFNASKGYFLKANIKEGEVEITNKKKIEKNAFSMMRNYGIRWLVGPAGCKVERKTLKIHNLKKLKQK